MKVLILGVNGFIGNALTEKILKTTDWKVYGMDLDKDKLGDLVNDDRFEFIEGDITINKEWIKYHVKKCDVILPLVAIATPKTYVQEPLKVFELDFEANLEIIKYCAELGKRVIFPSTSEVYGMSQEKEFNELNTNFVLGPIHKQRWIYSCSKQLIDRVIYAYGFQKGLNYTLIRPFNWVGPKLDRIDIPKEGSSRVITQFLGQIMRYEDITVVDEGKQKRCFTYIEDGVDCLIKIIENKDGCANKKIFNIGNPDNEMSILELAEKLIEISKKIKPEHFKEKDIKIIHKSEKDYYGEGYQDILTRKPDISEANKYLNWNPKFDLEQTLYQTVKYYFENEYIHN